MENENKIIAGIYEIKNKVDDKIYIGSSNNIHKRIQQHIYFLENKNHANKHLQNAFNKHGIDSFVYNILEVVDCENLCKEDKKNVLFKHEQTWLDEKQSYNPDIGYNISKEAKNPKYAITRDYLPRFNYCFVSSKSIINMNISIESKCFYYTIRDFIGLKNLLFIEDSYLNTIDDLCAKFLISKNELFTYLNELKNTNLLDYYLQEADGEYENLILIIINPIYYTYDPKFTVGNYDYICKQFK